MDLRQGREKEREEQIAGSPEPSPPAVEHPGALNRHDTYTVAPGDCLWSIAAAVLPSGAPNAEIGAEVARLWRINADRIGTGDPNLILVGTELLLR